VGRVGAIMRQIATLACVAAFLMSFDASYGFIERADPFVKLLLGGGLVFCAWLFVLWKDLRRSEQEHYTAEM
jgi:hypothetical protein